MSTYISIAGVSQSLSNLLTDRMVEPMTVTLAPPDVQVDQVTGPRLNIYLYHISENRFLKNQEIPGEGYPGAYGSPPLSLNLHYIFTAFGPSETGPDSDVLAQRILGDTMRVLHDTPTIAANLLQVKLPGTPVLDSSLLDEFEQIKVTLQPKSLEEISRIWTALPKVNFRRSVTYEVCVVQIDSEQARTLSLPVRQRNLFALTMQSPQIQQIFLQPPLFGAKVAAAQEGEILRLIGSNFQGSNTNVVMDGHAAAISNQLSSQLDATVPTGQLSAGIHSVQVVQSVMLTVVKGQPPVQRGGFSSNTVGFQLIPQITGPVTSGGTSGPAAPAWPTAPNSTVVDGTITWQLTATGAGPAPPVWAASTAYTMGSVILDSNNNWETAVGVAVTVAVSPAIGPNQEVTLLLGDSAFDRNSPTPGSPPSMSASFLVLRTTENPLPSGNYLMRIRVSGAESRLQVDTTTSSPTYLQYTGPFYTV